LITGIEENAELINDTIINAELDNFIKNDALRISQFNHQKFLNLVGGTERIIAEIIRISEIN